MRFSCVLFDHDDTLLPTFDLRARVLDRAGLEVLGHAVDGAAFLGEAHGRSLEQMAADLTDGDAARAARLVAAYRRIYYVENQRGLTPYAGVAETLAALSERGVRIGVVTSKLGAGALGELRACGLAGYVSHLVGAEDVARPKPAPEPFRKALGALDMEASQALMVGDTSADLLGARAAGVASAAALWGARHPDALRALEPDFVLTHPGEIVALLGNP